MPTRNVTVTEHFESFIEDGITSGRFRDANDLVQEALSLLEQRETERAKLEWLRTTTQEAFAALDRGEGVPISSPEDMDALVNGVMNEMQLAPSTARG